MSRAAFLVTLLNVAMAIAVPANRATPAEIAAKDDGARMERLADGVYAIIHERATEDWPHGNAGVIVGDDVVLVIDSDYLPARAEADMALIRSVTDKPVRYLVNTHWHGDHTHGNGIYRAAFPGLAIIGQRNNRPLIELNQLKLPKGALAPGSYNRVTMAGLQAQVAQGLDSAGRALKPEERSALERNLEERRIELEELARVEVAPPNLLFDDELVLELGSGKRVELRNRGRANSPNDVTIYLPNQRVLFTGDILVSPGPYVDGSYPGPWIDVLRDLEALPVAALVPGHGSVMHDHAYTRTVREVFETTRARTLSLYREGKNLAEAQNSVDISDLRTRFVNGRGVPYTAEDWKEWSGLLIARMVQCVHGFAC